MRIGSILRLNALLAAAAALSLFATQADAQTRLFNAASSADVSGQGSQRLQYIQSQATTNSYQVVTANTDALQGGPVEIALVGNGTVIAQHSKTNDRGGGDYSWFGTLPNGGNAILVVRDGEITGQIDNGLERYRIAPLGGGLHAMIKLDTTQFPAEKPPLRIPQNNQVIPDGNPAQPAANTVYDVLVAYTPKAATAAGNIASLVQLSVDVTNQAYTNSQIAITANLVGSMQVAYTETTSCGSDAFTCALDSLTNGTGPFAAVHTQRNTLGADEVVLLIDDSAFCGLAWLLSDATKAFAVVAASCSASNFSFPHEIGHNFGSDHDAANAGGSPPGFTDNRGYINPGNWRTVMSYPSPCNCPRIGYFSNPSVTYPGSPSGPMGVTNQSNNARVHNVRASTIAGFKQSAGSLPNLVSSVLPTSRSTQVPAPATAFATVINAGGGAGTSCGLSLGTPLAGTTFAYQTTNPATNQPTGTPNTAVGIPAGQSQSYVFSVTPSAAYNPTDTSIRATCSNASAPTVISGVNTMLLSASASPVPDIVALAASTDPGYVDLPGANGAGAFSVATVNVGASSTIIVQADTGAASLPVTITLCQTNSSAVCTNPATPAASTSLTIANNQTPTFSIFVKGNGNVANDPAANRVFVRFKDTGGNTRGSTSVAVRTQ